MHPRIAKSVAGDIARLEASLLDAFGPYCSLCERPIYEQVSAWNVRTRSTSTPYANGEQRDSDFLPICANCEEAQALWPDRSTKLALPFDEDPPSFSLLSSSTFSYRRQPVKVTYVTDDGKRVREETRDEVVIEASSDRGWATIRCFQLNGLAPAKTPQSVAVAGGRLSSRNAGSAESAQETGFRFVSNEAEAQRHDQRVSLRTHVWETALSAIDRWEHSDDNDRPRASRALQRLMTGSGFLCVWLTVLHQQVPDDFMKILSDFPHGDGRQFQHTDWQRLLPYSRA